MRQDVLEVGSEAGPHPLRQQGQDCQPVLSHLRHRAQGRGDSLGYTATPTLGGIDATRLFVKRYLFTLESKETHGYNKHYNPLISSEHYLTHDVIN